MLARSAISWLSWRGELSAATHRSCYIEDMAIKQLAYKYPCYPNKQQEKQLELEFAAARAVYNWGLATRKGIWEKEKRGIASMSKPDGLGRRLTKLKKKPDEYWPEHMGDTAWLNQASDQCLKNSLRNLDASYKNFFRRVKEGQKPGFPKFKIKGRSRKSVTYNIVHVTYDHDNQQLWLCKQSKQTGFPPLKIKWDRRLPNPPKSCTVSSNSIGKYYISFPVEEDIEALPVVGRMVGVDRGLKDVVVTSDGYKSGNPKNTIRYAKRLKLLQRQLRLKVKGSNNREKQKLKIAKLHRKIADSRNYFLHQETAELIQNADFIGLEKLNVQGMQQNRRLAKGVADASMFELSRQLTYKSDLYGRKVVVIDQWFPSSKTCSGCGHINETLTLATRKWTCSECGMSHDRDINAAKNVLAEALRLNSEENVT